MYKKRYFSDNEDESKDDDVPVVEIKRQKPEHMAIKAPAEDSKDDIINIPTLLVSQQMGMKAVPDENLPEKALDLISGFLKFSVEEAMDEGDDEPSKTAAPSM